MAQHVRIEVKGIHCEGCETTIRAALSKVPGVINVKASHATQLVEVVVQGDHVEQTARDRLRNLGFDPVG